MVMSRVGGRFAKLMLLLGVFLFKWSTIGYGVNPWDAGNPSIQGMAKEMVGAIVIELRARVNDPQANLSSVINGVADDLKKHFPAIFHQNKDRYQLEQVSEEDKKNIEVASLLRVINDNINGAIVRFSRVSNATEIKQGIDRVKERSSRYNATILSEEKENSSQKMVTALYSSLHNLRHDAVRAFIFFLLAENIPLLQRELQSSLLRKIKTLDCLQWILGLSDCDTLFQINILNGLK
jgi:hypothetical protein